MKLNILMTMEESKSVSEVCSLFGVSGPMDSIKMQSQNPGKTGNIWALYERGTVISRMPGN